MEDVWFDLLKKYKPAIKPNKKTVAELIRWLGVHYDIIALPLSEFSNAFHSELNNNVKNSIANYPLQLTNEEFDFVAYKLPETEKNIQRGIKRDWHERVYVIFEKKTGYLSCNNARVFLELRIEQGVGQADYDNNSIFLKDYINCMEHMRKEEY
ncbi:hypothetical protein LJC07_07460 [Christensenellaceae bacterium OttesenSCG-928-L17]|nr:hypothetical protein [Christensenellaceae bacterium OttesenSCG-928-L17]